MGQSISAPVMSVAKLLEATADKEGEAALWCEGNHKQWAHASCVGVSESLYKALQGCNMPWICQSCILEAMTAWQSLPQLKATVEALQNSVGALRMEVSQLKEADHPAAVESETAIATIHAQEAEDRPETVHLAQTDPTSGSSAVKQDRQKSSGKRRTTRRRRNISILPVIPRWMM